MTADQWIALIVALGVGSLLRELATGGWQWITGRQERDRTALQQAVTELDRVMVDRRRLEESLSEHRVMLLEQGVAKADLPEWPRRARGRDDDMEG